MMEWVAAQPPELVSGVVLVLFIIIAITLVKKAFNLAITVLVIGLCIGGYLFKFSSDYTLVVDGNIITMDVKGEQYVINKSSIVNIEQISNGVTITTKDGKTITLELPAFIINRITEE